MASCGVCTKGVSSKHIKVVCSDCEKVFHAQCMKMSKADVEVLTTEQLPWRCDPCAADRRRSMRLESRAEDGKLTLEDVMEAIRGIACEQKQIVKDFNTSYESLSNRLDEISLALKSQSDKVAKCLETIDSLSSENKALRERVGVLERRLDDAEQYSRRNCVEIQGVPEVPDENVLEVVKSVGKAIGMEVVDTMVDACHRLRKRPGTSGPAGIVVKFVRRMDADLMMVRKRAKKRLSTVHLGLQMDTTVYINESLSPARRRLYAVAREAKRSKGYKWLWVRGGRILMKKEDNGPVIHINSQADLE